MMSMSQGWSGLRVAVIALGFLAWTAPGVKAAETKTPVPNLLVYGTSGAVDLGTGITGTNVVSYVPITDAKIDPTTNIPLGSFQVTALPDGQTTTYANTPFSISFVPSAFNGITMGSEKTEMPVLSGVLNGSITGGYQADVKVSFNPIDNPTFAIGGGTGTLNLGSKNQTVVERLLVPSSAGGTTTLEGSIVTKGLPISEHPSPEPSTIALFLSMVGGLGLRKYVLARRQRGQA